jgi:hypothetical protein
MTHRNCRCDFYSHSAIEYRCFLSSLSFLHLSAISYKTNSFCTGLNDYSFPEHGGDFTVSLQRDSIDLASSVGRIFCLFSYCDSLKDPNSKNCSIHRFKLDEYDTNTTRITQTYTFYTSSLFHSSNNPYIVMIQSCLPEPLSDTCFVEGLS